MRLLQDDKGVALIMAMIVVMIIACISAAYLTLATISSDKVMKDQEDLQTLYLAESGMSASLVELASGAQGAAGDGKIGGGAGEDDPINMYSCAYDSNGVEISQMLAGTYNVELVVDEIGKKVLHAHGITAGNGRDRTIEFIMIRGTTAIYDNAIFAGNSSGDSAYFMPFGGTGNQNDEITGDIYSGRDIQLVGDSVANGNVRAKGVIEGESHVTGEALEGNVQPVPDLQSMNYDQICDIDVAAQFAQHGYSATSGFGGTADQVPEEYASHVFRKNPSDRANECSGTAGNDYFLEDPYQNVRVDPNQNGSDASHITFGKPSQGQEEGNHKIYYIDGNLWLHNRKTYSFKFYDEHSNGVTATFVVKGNIYFSDNLFYTNKNKDGVAFIAMKDENVPDSGNIYIGDPVFGTVNELNSFLYAENDFYDLNLDEQGSYEFEIHGNMTAGNHVNINRDYETLGGGHYRCKCCGADPFVGRNRCKNCGGRKWTCREWLPELIPMHSKMTVTFDSRIKDGLLNLPGLPTGGSVGAWTMACRREFLKAGD